MDFPTRFDVIVIGGGHAGTEAALAAARMGSQTLLLTHNIETLGQMSCNPAIGGIGKSHLVKEIDALGGAMAHATDLAGIQFRVLNSRKGPAVRATRAQADRVLYKAAIRHTLENQSNLTLFQQAADDLIVENDQVTGVVSQTGIRFNAKTVGTDDRHFPWWCYPHWHAATLWRPSWRCARQCAGSAFTGVAVQCGPAENRHTAAY